jgi:zinc D-Ala-D-Ala carboxypeptidase
MKIFKRIFILTAYVVVLKISAVCAQTTLIAKSFLTGRYDYTRDTSFTKVDRMYSNNSVYLKKETYASYKKMYAAALKDGVKLSIISGTRNFNDQHYKWDTKWRHGQYAGIKNTAVKTTNMLRWWSMPGTSRHHWGTDIDMTNMNLSFYKSPAGKKMFDWLSKNAAKFGFYQPFNAGRSTGYQEEKWHWSYLPLSKIYLREYIKQVSYMDIFGFNGSHTAKELGIIQNWVLGINPVCK